MFFACNQGEKESVNKIEKGKNKFENTYRIAKIPKVKEVDSNALALNFENFKKVYTLNGGKGNLYIDSIISDTLIHIKLTTLPQNPGSRTKPYLWFEIFHFKTDSLATEYYNKLKTIEMVSGFGIDKRPKNLFLNGNKIIYHHMEHGYGHNYLKYIQNFNSIIKLDRSAKNLDSIIGFTYCSCRHAKADLKPLLGKWKVEFISKIHTEDHTYYPGTDTSYFNSTLPEFIIFKKDSVQIDEITTFIRHTPTSIELPDSYYYMRYAFIQNNWNEVPEDSVKQNFYTEFWNEAKKIQSKKSSIISYDFNLDIRVYPHIIRLADKTTYLIVHNRFYRLIKQ